jgi:hypothetical protein
MTVWKTIPGKLVADKKTNIRRGRSSEFPCHQHDRHCQYGRRDLT